MSMSLYLMSGPEAELIKLARDPDAIGLDANFLLFKDYITTAATRGNAAAIWMS